ncbi:patatin-like phospholipase family protein [Burkholderia sp. Ac-20365]|uniref:patatin-like phospholipase family protein n=1 Tax=Burkholderia sp. Ac-20365 TaxID=2703897 RepID=UPI00197B2BEF|nr:patatin-like phospholipase family protein [Burkholderia sp. Ac-20365]MBN3767317.1 patatin [Burkholderia sp. Ac-20365]
MAIRRRYKRIGLVLGGGAARGWAHIGAIRALHDAGIKPDLVAGTSIGALVGAVYANGDLDWLEEWVTGLTWQSVVRLLDLRFSGGLLGGKKVIQVFANRFNGREISQLHMPFAAVATELDTGRETWLQEGGVVDAVRASIAIPGIFTPVLHEGVWLVDGGLSNPVPVSAARGMRADCVIAVDLNNDILNGRDFGGAVVDLPPMPVEETIAASIEEPGLLALDPDAPPPEIATPAPPALLRRNGKPFPAWLQPSPEQYSRDVRVPPAPSARVPSMLSSIAQSIDIMQVRITRSRLAGEPADILIQPRLAGMGIFDFHRAGPAIAEGRAAVEANLPAIRACLGID